MNSETLEPRGQRERAAWHWQLALAAGRIDSVTSVPRSAYRPAGACTQYTALFPSVSLFSAPPAPVLGDLLNSGSSAAPIRRGSQADGHDRDYEPAQTS
jgi:hypothetical protein